ncbi:hypothetical protein SMD44_08332 [Streptomyces alboflavus]|uniref:NACHT N-terminal Helical domain-containing protein n=1 Tax=Streptomyces alboflavus TaxID=67267 RepID=A0A1Z1WQY3_9ACTN|nr:hypothetical protein [Streptomyces alboflavus]ARX88845.1 hypothetical protein SMD44_08332 [Streptomyces alboflavus]
MLSFGDALKLLGGDPPAVAALDRALGGALNLATGGLSGGVLGMFDARGRVLGLGRDAWRGLGERLGRTDGRVERTAVLEAAHTVIVVLAFFDALERVELPFSLDEVALTGREQLLVAGGGFPSGDGFTQDVGQVDAPRPAPHLPYENHTGELRAWYEHLAMRTLDFLRGLAVWDRLDDAAGDAAADTVRSVVPGLALQEYEALYARLVLEAPEFAFWSGQMEHQATRAELRRRSPVLSGSSPRAPHCVSAPWTSRAPSPGRTSRRLSSGSSTPRRLPRGSWCRPWPRPTSTPTSGCGPWTGRAARRTRSGGHAPRSGGTSPNTWPEP